MAVKDLTEGAPLNGQEREKSKDIDNNSIRYKFAR